MVQHSSRKRTAATDQTPAPGRQPTRKSTAIKPHPHSATASEQRVPLLLEHFPGPDRERVSFSFYAPGAREVWLAGSFNDWRPGATPLTNQDGRWTIELELRRGRHEYRFLVDGSWTDDPLAAAFVPNPFGTLNCLLLVG